MLQEFKKLKVENYILAAIFSNGVAYIFYSIATLSSLGQTPAINFLIASLSALPISYALNRFWVFKSMNRVIPEMIRFISGYVTALIAGYFLLPLLMHKVSNPYLAQLLSMFILGVVAFAYHSLHTFAIRKH